jgi:hypothetical protein
MYFIFRRRSVRDAGWDDRTNEGTVVYYIVICISLLGKSLVNKFLEFSFYGKQSVAKSRKTRTNGYSSLLGNNQ